MLHRASSPNIAPSIRSMSYMKILIPTVSSTDGLTSMQTPWNFEGSEFVLVLRKRLSNFDVSSSSLPFPCKWRTTALKRQKMSLYDFLVFCY